jgi:hypothetical protein
VTLSTILIPWDGRNEAWLTECLNSFPNGTPFVIAKNNGKREMHAALNAALDEITTPYTFVCGADDLAGPGMLEMLEDAIGDADGVYPRMELFGDREQTFEPPHYGRHIIQWRNTCGVFLVKTSVLRAVGGWRLAVVEDWDLMNRIAKAGYRFERILPAEYRYRQHQQSLTQRIEHAARDESFSQDDQLREILGDRLERYPVEAVFMPSASPGVAYVRGSAPAEPLPGIVAGNIPHGYFGCDAIIAMHPASEALDVLNRFGDEVLVIGDVDDAYVSEQLVPDLYISNLRAVGNQWFDQQPDHVEFVQRCPAVFCATPHLAELYADYNPHVYLLRNSILEADWRRVREPMGDGKLRIGWAASRQHERDAPLVAEALRRVKKRHPNVEVMLVTNFPAPASWDFEYVQQPQTISLAAYRALLASFDISIAPIRNHEMGRGKSDLKWLESSMAGAAFIGSNAKPYATVKHGRTGLLADTPQEWEEAIETLIVDDTLRLKLAQAARRHVVTNRTAQKTAYLYRKALREIRTRAGMRVAA